MLDHPSALPNKCVSCSVGFGDASYGDKKRKFIDTTLDLDFYGVVYFCTNCFIEIANALGFVSPEQHTGMVTAFKAIRASARELVAENENLRHSAGLLVNHRCYSSSIISLPEDDVVDGGGPGVLPEEDAGVGSDVNESSPDNVEPDVIKQPANVHGTAKPDKPKRNVLEDLGL